MGAALELPAGLPEPEEWAREEHRYPAPEGTRFVWRAESTDPGFGLEWSTDPARLEGKGCRFATRRPSCEGAPVAAIQRGTAERPRWWAYCADHLFGRRLGDDGIVYALTLEEVSTDGSA